MPFLCRRKCAALVSVTGPTRLAMSSFVRFCDAAEANLCDDEDRLCDATEAALPEGALLCDAGLCDAAEAALPEGKPAVLDAASPLRSRHFGIAAGRRRGGARAVRARRP